MKVELMKNISQEFEENSKSQPTINIDVNDSALERRGPSSRYTYHCQCK